MTMRAWGYIVPSQIYVLRLAGFLPERDTATEIYIGTDEERLGSMVRGRRDLVRMTGDDFGYDLCEWHQYLVQHAEHGYGFGDPQYVWSSVEAAGADPSHLRLSRILSADTFVDPSWLTSPVLALSRRIDAEQAFDLLPILADALQDAGCNNEDILGHCRDPDPHVGGCWVVDLVLGKE